jgi:hypothetical protein
MTTPGRAAGRRHRHRRRHRLLARSVRLGAAPGCTTTGGIEARLSLP